MLHNGLMTPRPHGSQPADCLTYTVAETATLLGLSRNSAYEAARRGEIPTIRVGRRILVPRSRLGEMLDGLVNPDELDDGTS